LIPSKIARRLVLPMMATNAVPPTWVFGMKEAQHFLLVPTRKQIILPA
jgi:hypothetical protein